MSGIGILVNPMAGRDVRRVAARASTVTFEAKRDAVARIAAGADALGVDAIHVVEDPFRVATVALQWMPLKACVHVLAAPVSHGAADTEAAIAGFAERGVGVVVSLGGDGTHRDIARQQRDITLVALSTGTNNVFPVLAEPTVAGMVAALAAKDLLPPELMPRCKLLHVALANGQRDLAVVDAAFLADDFIGNMRPFAAAKLRQLLLARAEPDAIGTSPIGGFLEVVEDADDCGLLVRMGAGGRDFNVPLSPGHFRRVSVADVQRLPFDVPAIFQGRGVLALDGDRRHRLDGDPAHIVVRRDGPRIVNIAQAMRYAAANRLLG